MVSILDKLVEIDSDREFRYKDKKTALLFNEKTRNLKENQSLDLTDLPSNYIPLLSKLLLAKKISFSSTKLQESLDKLPFLVECTLI
ncbi:unnamed protein product [Mucor hiemalis]